MKKTLHDVNILHQSSNKMQNAGGQEVKSGSKLDGGSLYHARLKDITREMYKKITACVRGKPFVMKRFFESEFKVSPSMKAVYINN